MSGSGIPPAGAKAPGGAPSGSAAKAKAWLFLGPELGEKKAAIAKIREELVKAHGDGLEESRFYATDTKPSELAQCLLSGSLFSTARLVTYLNVDAIGGKAELKPLLEYLARPAPDATLVITSDQATAEKPLKDAVGEANCRVFWELYENRKEEWVRNFFRKSDNAIGPDAVAAILELVENNTEALRLECEKLALFSGPGKAIDEETVNAFLSHNRSEDAFSLYDRMVGSGLEEALETLDKILFSKESDGVALIAGLTWSFKRLDAYQNALAAGMSHEEASLRSGIRSKPQQKTARDAHARFGRKGCEGALAALVETDAALRSGSQNREKAMMQLLVYRIMAKKGEPLLATEDHRS